MPPRLAYPLRPEAKWDEGLGGFLCRYFGMNGYRIPLELRNDLAEFYRLRPRQLKEQGPQALSEFFRKEDRGWLNARMDIWAAISGNRKLFTPVAPKICPACIHQFNFYRVEWDFPFVEACIIHHCQLQTHCTCGQRFTWARLGPDWQCSCGHSATDLLAKAASVGQVHIAKLVGSRVIRACHMQQQGRPLAGQLQRINHLYELLDHLVQLLMLKVSLFGKRRSLLDRWRVLGRLLDQWPWGFIRTALMELRWSYRGRLKEQFVYVRRDTEMVRCLKWLDALNNNESPYSFQIIYKALQRRLRSPISTNCGVISNPALTERQQAQRLGTFATWWGSATQFKAEANRKNIPHVSHDFQRLVLRLQLINALIQAANEGVPPDRLNALVLAWPGRPTCVAPTPFLLIQFLDWELASFSRRTLQILYDETQLALGKENISAHV